MGGTLKVPDKDGKAGEPQERTDQRRQRRCNTTSAGLRQRAATDRVAPFATTTRPKSTRSKSTTTDRRRSLPTIGG